MRTQLIRAAVVALAVGAGIAAGYSAGAQPVPEKGEQTSLKPNQVMRVGDKVITAEQLLARIWDFENMLEPKDRVLAPSLAYLRDTALLELESKRLGFALTTQEIDAETKLQIERVKKQVHDQTRGMVPFEKWLERQGLTSEQFEAYIRERAYLILAKRVLVHHFEQTTPSVESSHILHKTLAEAQATHKILKETDAKRLREKFEDLAVQRSTDPGAGVSKGGLPRLYENDDTLVRPVADAIWALKDGQFSEPVKSEFGWHVVVRWRTIVPPVRTVAEMRAQLLKEPDRDRDVEYFNRWVRWVFNTQKYPLERRLPGFDCPPDKQG